MKLTFVVQDINPTRQKNFHFAIGALSASLKQANHRVSLLHYAHVVEEPDLVQDITREAPDLVGFSSATPGFRHIPRMASWIKRSSGLPVICGGVHATLEPHAVLDEPDIDMVCIGEGDRAIVELCDALEQGRSIASIRSIWSKQNGHRYTPPVRPLVGDLDELPVPDREVFDFAQLHESRNGAVRVKVGRGCPMRCSYCCNHSIQECYPNPERYVRYRSVDSVLDELEGLVSAHPFIEFVLFHDDIFPPNKAWLRRFVAEYPPRIGLPFRVACRPERMDEETARLLAQAGCVKVNLGIESGNERIRRDVLNRHMSDQQIEEAFARCRKHGMSTQSYFMIGMPFEDTNTILETFKLNARVKADAFIKFFFYPFPRTRAYQICRERGFLTERHVDSYWEGTILQQPTLSQEQVLFAYQFCYPTIRAYMLLRRLPSPARAVGERMIAGIYASRWIPHGTVSAAYRTATWWFRLGVLQRIRRRFPLVYLYLRALKETRYQAFDD